MIHIACNIDANFIQHCAVTLVSLFENNKRADICVHIVAPYLSEADQAILRNLAAPYGNEVCFYYPPKDLLQCFFMQLLRIANSELNVRLDAAVSHIWRYCSRLALTSLR